MYYVSFPQKGFQFSTTSFFRQNSSCSHSWQSPEDNDLLSWTYLHWSWQWPLMPTDLCLRPLSNTGESCSQARHSSFFYLLFFSRMFFLRKHVSTKTSYFLLRQCPSTPLHCFTIDLKGCKHEWILRIYAKWDKSITEEQISLKSPVVKSNKQKVERWLPRTRGQCSRIMLNGAIVSILQDGNVLETYSTAMWIYLA